MDGTKGSERWPHSAARDGDPLVLLGIRPSTHDALFSFPIWLSLEIPHCLKHE